MEEPSPTISRDDRGGYFPDLVMSRLFLPDGNMQTLIAELLALAVDPAGLVVSCSRASTYPVGSRALWLAVIEDVFSVQQKPGRRLQRQRAVDQAWLVSESDSVGSFLWVCTQLRLDAKRLRRAYFQDEHRLS
jgi:hypothetical protein